MISTIGQQAGLSVVSQNTICVAILKPLLLEQIAKCYLSGCLAHLMPLHVEAAAVLTAAESCSLT